VKFDRDRPMMEYYRNLRRNGDGKGTKGDNEAGGGDD
jgi:hypothetical protein